MRAIMDQDPSQMKPNPTKIKPNPNPNQAKIKSNQAKSKSNPNQKQNQKQVQSRILESHGNPYRAYEILGPRTSAVPSLHGEKVTAMQGPRGDCALRMLWVPWPPPWAGRASGASEAGDLGTTKEVLGSIIAFLAFNFDFQGFPIIALGFPRFSIRILPGF